MPIQLSRRRIYQAAAIFLLVGGIVIIVQGVVLSIIDIEKLPNQITRFISGIIMMSVSTIFAFRAKNIPETQTVTLCDYSFSSNPPQQLP